MSKRTLPSVAPMSQWLTPHGVPERVIVVRGMGTGITGVTISVRPRSALRSKLRQGCDIPTAADGLDQQHARVHPAPQNVDGVPFLQ
jgi:hypothetical protein